MSLVPRANDDAGLWRFDKGAEVYAYNLHRYTTTTMSADQIHQIGLQQVARLEKEMDAILRRLGRTEGTVNARIAQLEKDLQKAARDLAGNRTGDDVLIAAGRDRIDDADELRGIALAPCAWHGRHHEGDRRQPRRGNAQPSPSIDSAGHLAVASPSSISNALVAV